METNRTLEVFTSLCHARTERVNRLCAQWMGYTLKWPNADESLQVWVPPNGQGVQNWVPKYVDKWEAAGEVLEAMSGPSLIRHDIEHFILRSASDRISAQAGLTDCRPIDIAVVAATLQTVGVSREEINSGHEWIEEVANGLDR